MTDAPMNARELGLTSRAAVTARSTSAGYPPAPAAARRSGCQPVFSHHSPGVSPGTGIIALTSTSMRTGTRAQAIAAVKPPIDWATSTTSSPCSVAAAAAAATLSVYSGSPADSSGPGRSTAVAWWPRATSSGTTRCQYQVAAPPAPGISVKALMKTPLSRRDQALAA